MWEFFYLKGFDFSMERLHGGKLNRKFKVSFSVTLFFFVTKKALRCLKGLCDKKTPQTLQIPWRLLKFILSATLDKLPLVQSEK